MGMDVVAGKIHLRQNWTGWGAMRELLAAHGFKGKLPNDNSGDTVSKATARKVGVAMLRFYMAKDQQDTEGMLPQLSRHEAACLAYALLLAVSNGKARHH